MKGAREYAKLFNTGQHKKLYLVSSSHARGKTFRIFILPEGKIAKPNHNNAPLNSDAVEVYGVVLGQPGWTEVYGWIHKGPWQEDFYRLLDQVRILEELERVKTAEFKKTKARGEREKVNNLLEDILKGFQMKDLFLEDLLEDLWYLFRHAEDKIGLWQDECLKFEEKIRRIQSYVDYNRRKIIIKDFYPIKEK